MGHSLGELDLAALDADGWVIVCHQGAKQHVRVAGALEALLRRVVESFYDSLDVTLLAELGVGKLRCWGF
jgi:hypothetical protein